MHLLGTQIFKNELREVRKQGERTMEYRKKGRQKGEIFRKGDKAV